MKYNRLLLILLFIFIAGCRKNEKISPGNQNPPPNSDSLKTLPVASIFQSNMVIQRDKPFLIWGKAIAKTNVIVNASWNNSNFNAISDSTGNWQVVIPASGANAAPQTITVKADGYNTRTLTNVLIGDVWICSGQSNMVFPVDSIAPFGGVTDFKAEVAGANYPEIRTISINQDDELLPVFDFVSPSKWNVCSPATIGNVSAVAYFFARKLNISLNIPIGIIVSAVNGSYCQDWTNKEALQNDPVLSTNYLAGSSYLFNGMISPLTKLSIKGFTWYQGENNQHINPPANYTILNSALIKGWRTVFNQPELPFYYVQLTPFAEDYNSTTPPGGNLVDDYLALFREAQANVRATPSTGMVITMDVGEAANHHPHNKKPVGERLALLALNNTYGQNIQSVGPQFESFTANGNIVTVNFAPGTADGLNTIGNSPLKQYFFIAGSDHVFRQGSAVISGHTILVTAAKNTPMPVQAIRYAFTNAPVTNLQNSAGLPAEPFRSDK